MRSMIKETELDECNSWLLERDTLNPLSSEDQVVIREFTVGCALARRFSLEVMAQCGIDAPSTAATREHRLGNWIPTIRVVSGQITKMVINRIRNSGRGDPNVTSISYGFPGPIDDMYFNVGVPAHEIQDIVFRFWRHVK